MGPSLPPPHPHPLLILILRAFMIASANAFLPSSSDLSTPFPTRHEDSDLSRAALSQVTSTVDWMASTLTSTLPLLRLLISPIAGLGSLNRLIAGDMTGTASRKPLAPAPDLEEDEDDTDSDSGPIEFPEMISAPALAPERGQEDQEVAEAQYCEQEGDEEEGEEDVMMGSDSTHSTHSLL